MHGAYQAYQEADLDCGPFSPMHAGLHLASDLCSIVDNCPSVQPQTFLNVLKECKFGDAKKAPDTIVGQLCDPELERDATGDYNSCYQAIEAVFKQDIPISALKCLYHSQVDWPMLIDAAREYGGDAASTVSGGSSFEPYPMREEYDAVSDAVDAKLRELYGAHGAPPRPRGGPLTGWCARPRRSRPPWRRGRSPSSPPPLGIRTSWFRLAGQRVSRTCRIRNRPHAF